MDNIKETNGMPRRNQALDLMKLGLAFLVVMIHAEVEVGILTPLLWMALPLFFITSGYFFFGKIRRAGSKDEETAILRRFIKRNMKLYGFWFLVLLPVTLYIRDWFSGTLPEAVLKFVQSFLFNSTFRGSWYIMALVIGVPLVYAVSKKIKTAVMLAVTFAVYVLCCLFSNYYGLVADDPAVMGVYNGYVEVFSSLNNSFPAGLFWITVGKLLAQREPTASPRYARTAAAVSAVLLILEHLLVTGVDLASTHNGYLLFTVFCPAVFCCVKDMRISAPAGLRPAPMSTVIYAAHTSVVSVAGAVLRRVTPLEGSCLQWCILLVTVLICLAGCWVIFTFEKKKGFRWLQNAY